MVWRLINSGFADGNMNMAIDEAILTAYADGRVPPTLRFYGWNQPTLSIGYFQRIEKEVNLVSCQEQGVNVVRRLTGGRAVLHHKELTYSIIVKEDYPLLPKTITASYRFFSEGLLQALGRMGIDARMNLPRQAYAQTVKPNHSSSACFDSPSNYEITVGGRKIIGSAQVRKQGVLLQHGSILLDFAPKLLATILQLPPSGEETFIQILTNKVTSLSDEASRPIGWQEAYEVFVPALSNVLGEVVELGALTSDELMLSRQLASVKYQSEDWTFRR